MDIGGCRVALATENKLLLVQQVDSFYLIPGLVLLYLDTETMKKVHDVVDEDKDQQKPLWIE